MSSPSAGSTSVVRWNAIVPEEKAADVALQASQRGQSEDERLLPPTAVQGNSVTMEECSAPSDRSVHMRTTLHRKPPTPTSALIESAEFAIAAVLSGPLSLTNGDTPPQSTQSQCADLSVEGSLLNRQGAAKSQQAKKPAVKSAKKTQRATARKRAVRRAHEPAAAQLAVRMTKSMWPQRAAGSKALGVGPAPLLAAAPTFSALSCEEDTVADQDHSPPVPLSYRPTDDVVKDITRSGACVRDEDAWVSSTSSWVSPTLRRRLSTDTLAGAGEHAASDQAPLRRQRSKRAALYAVSERGSKHCNRRYGTAIANGPCAGAPVTMDATLKAEYARIKLSTHTLEELATEAAEKRAAVEQILGGIEQGKRDILENQSRVAKSWLDRQLLTNMVAEVEELVQRVQVAADGEQKEWFEATAALRKSYAQKRWVGLRNQQQMESETDKLGGLIEGVTVSDEGGKQGVVFVLKSGEDGDGSRGGSSGDSRRSWTWADHEAAKLQLAKRRQAEAAEAEVHRLQELLQSYQAKHDQGVQRLEKKTSRLRAEKQAGLARMEERTAAAQHKRREQAAEAVRRRRAAAAANAAVSEEQKVVSKQAKLALIEARTQIHASKVKKAEERRKVVAESQARHQARTKQRLEVKRKVPSVVRWEKPPLPLSEAQIAARLPAPPHPRAAAHVQLSESYSKAALYEKAFAEAEKGREVEGRPFLRQLCAASKALAGLGDYPGALAALEQTSELECREEERTQVQSDIRTLQRVANEVAAAEEAAMQPIY